MVMQEGHQGLPEIRFSSEICEKFSTVLSQRFPFIIVDCYLYKKLLLKNNKEILIYCTGFPTLGFSGDNCPKIIVSLWYLYFFIFCLSILIVKVAVEFISIFAEVISVNNLLLD